MEGLGVHDLLAKGEKTNSSGSTLEVLILPAYTTLHLHAQDTWVLKHKCLHALDGPTWRVQGSMVHPKFAKLQKSL